MFHKERCWLIMTSSSHCHHTDLKGVITKTNTICSPSITVWSTVVVLLCGLLVRVSGYHFPLPQDLLADYVFVCPICYGGKNCSVQEGKAATNVVATLSHVYWTAYTAAAVSSEDGDSRGVSPALLAVGVSVVVVLVLVHLIPMAIIGQ